MGVIAAITIKKAALDERPMVDPLIVGSED
jgi:hypothetical protein